MQDRLKAKGPFGLNLEKTEMESVSEKPVRPRAVLGVVPSTPTEYLPYASKPRNLTPDRCRRASSTGLDRSHAITSLLDPCSGRLAAAP